MDAEGAGKVMGGLIKGIIFISLVSGTILGAIVVGIIWLLVKFVF